MKPISLDIDYTSKKKEHKIKQVLFSIHITGDDDAQRKVISDWLASNPLYKADQKEDLDESHENEEEKEHEHGSDSDDHGPELKAGDMSMMSDSQMYDLNEHLPNINKRISLQAKQTITDSKVEWQKDKFEQMADITELPRELLRSEGAKNAY